VERMREFNAYYDDETEEFLGTIDNSGVKRNIDRTIRELNSLEKGRVEKKSRIEKYKKREELYQRVIGGLMAYIELKVNDELWWDWNE